MPIANAKSGHYKNLVAAYQNLMLEVKALEKTEKDLHKKILTAIDKEKMSTIVNRIKNTSK